MISPRASPTLRAEAANFSSCRSRPSTVKDASAHSMRCRCVKSGAEPQLAVAVADRGRIELAGYGVAGRRVALLAAVAMQGGHQLAPARIEHLVGVGPRRFLGNGNAAGLEYLVRACCRRFRRVEPAVEACLHEYLQYASRRQAVVERRRDHALELGRALQQPERSQVQISRSWTVRCGRSQMPP